MASTRRLAAILAADMAGYSRLMEADEEGTLERLKAHRRELIDPKIAEHHGRIVKTTGDGLLAEFASVVDAVRCAAEVQRGMLDREPELPDERRIRLRIGINLGDVIAEGDDIFGDGVNVAARLEGLAEPGGICISRMVRDQIRDKLPYPFEDMGEQIVKNIARPVRAYSLGLQGVVELLTVGAPSGPPIRQPLVAPRLSIVVLPFTNLSNDADQQYFADGITEDLTTDLSRIPETLVISRNTAFTYRNRSADAKQIGRELGVRYVLEGSVRRVDKQIRVNAQLIDAETNAHLWAERFDRYMGDLFALQNDITSRIAVALHQEVIGVEAARPTDHPDALDYLLRGRAAYSKLGGDVSDNTIEAISWFERALAADPDSVEAKSSLARALAERVVDGMTNSAAADVERAEGLVAQALAASPRGLRPHFAKGWVLRAQGRYEEAMPEFETVITLDRNFWWAYGQLAMCKFYTGSIEEAIPLLEQALRLNPRHPNAVDWYLSIGRVDLLKSDLDEAVVWFEKARLAAAEYAPPHAYLASTYALRGDTERAAAELAEARKLSRDDRYSSLARLKATQYWGVPKVRALFEATYFVGLRKAGVPEE